MMGGKIQDTLAHGQTNLFVCGLFKAQLKIVFFSFAADIFFFLLLIEQARVYFSSLTWVCIVERG